MRTEYLNCLVHVVDYGSINRAAEVLFLSPQGVSHSIHQLEKELGTPLFYREKTGLRLTCAGEIVYEEAGSILSGVRRITDALGQQSAQPRAQRVQTLTVISTARISAALLPRLLNTAHKRAPQLDLRVQEAMPDRITEQLESAEGDRIAIVGIPERSRAQMLAALPRDYRFAELLTCPMEALVSSDSPLAGRPSLPAEELSRRPLVAFNQDESLLKLYGIPCKKENILLCSGNLGLCRAALAGEPRALGLTNRLVEEYCRRRKNNALCTVPIDPPLRLTYGYIATERVEQSAGAAEFLKLLRAAFEPLS